jgi:tetratricopeptide (TPR) repeat protein
MKPTSTTLALALAAAGIATASPTYAQATAPAPDAPAEANQVNISKAARKEVVELQTAVNAKDTANIPAKLAAAQAKAKTKEDRHFIAQLQLKAAVDANDDAGMTAAIEAIHASGAVPIAEVAKLYGSLATTHYRAKAFDKAGAALERVIQLEPNNLDAAVTLAETRNAQGRTAEAVSLLQKAISAKAAAGQKVDESWYQRAVGLSYHAKLPNAPELGRQWVAAYPSPKNWRDTIRIYQTSGVLDEASFIDAMRLSHAAGALQGENDYYRFASALVTKGFSGEAKAVLEQGFAGKSIDKSKQMFSELYSLASTRAQGDRESLAGAASAAKAAPDAKKAMVTADAYYGYGDYAQAAELYRVALTKSGVDKDLANLRLGMALARAGDKAGATTALNAAGGGKAEVAKLWLTYLATKG